MKKKVCRVLGCGRPRYVRGWCSRHYDRWRAHGNPRAGRQSPGYRAAWIEQHVNYDGEDCLFPPFGKGYRAVVTINGVRMRTYSYMNMLVRGEPKRPNLITCHTCRGGDAGCVNPNHLYWGTHKQNMRDKERDGTDNHRGSRHGGAKLTEKDVLFIRKQVAKGVRQKTLAEKYGVSRQTIGDISTRKRWAWLEPE